MLTYLYDKLSRINNFKLILVMCLIKVSVSFALQLISKSYFQNQDYINTSLEGMGTGVIFLIVVILGPLIETLLFQFLLIELVILLFKSIKIRGGQFIGVLVSSFLFAAAHPYSFIYLLSAFLSGVIYGFFYIISKNRKGLNGFLVVYIVHSFYNLIVFLTNEYC